MPEVRMRRLSIIGVLCLAPFAALADSTSDAMKRDAGEAQSTVKAGERKAAELKQEGTKQIEQRVQKLEEKGANLKAQGKQLEKSPNRPHPGS
jgi:hypothetical protein